MIMHFTKHQVHESPTNVDDRIIHVSWKYYLPNFGCFVYVLLCLVIKGEEAEANRILWVREPVADSKEFTQKISRKGPLLLNTYRIFCRT